MPKLEISRSVWTNPLHFVAFGFGAGLVPWAPGTFGTLMAIPFYLLFHSLTWQWYFILLLIAFAIGIWVCDEAEKFLGVQDYPGIVWDEMVGFWVTMFQIPFGWKSILLAFILFRVFDIWKPWPISFVNRHLHGGFGVMFDDILAAIVANLVLRLLVPFGVS